MTKYCKTQVTLRGDADEVAAALAHVTTKQSALDFHAVLPMPEAFLDTKAGTLADLSESAYIYRRKKEVTPFLAGRIGNINPTNYLFTRESDIDYDLGRRLYENRQAYDGCASWHDWCIKHWGTPTEASSIVRIDNTFVFETHDSAPLALLQAWSAAFPHVCFDVAYDARSRADFHTLSCKAGEIRSRRVFTNRKAWMKSLEESGLVAYA